MRAGVDYHFLAQGPQLVGRGVGRYTQQQLRSVLAVDQSNHYVLLCARHADLSLIAPDIRDAPNVDLACYTAPGRPGVAAEDPGSILERAEHFQDWVYRQGIDVYHATAPLMLDAPDLPGFDACAAVATLYDLIPLHFPRQYLDPHGTHDRYSRALGLLCDATRIIAISDAARQDAMCTLGIPAERIERAWPAPDPIFRVLPAHLLAKYLVILGSRVRIPERYVLTVSHLHHTKNLATLLAGYAQLPARLRTRVPLVVCCHLDPPGVHHLRHLAASLGIGDDLVVTGGVSDAELCALYNQATLVVHPSRFEGFGYPVAEAMACGAPVVTTTASSLPEVAGDAGVLVDAEDPGAFTEAIARLAADPEARASMRQRGLAWVTRFDRAELGRHTLATYRSAAAGAPAGVATGDTSLRIAMWTPLPPLRTGIADYSAELLAGLQERCEVEVFVDGGYLPSVGLGVDLASDPTGAEAGGLRPGGGEDGSDHSAVAAGSAVHSDGSGPAGPVGPAGSAGHGDTGRSGPAGHALRLAIHHFSAFERRNRQRPFDAVVYQMGASPFHRYMATSQALRRHRGIVVLHDMIWSNVIYTAPDDSMDFAGELVRLHGAGAVSEFATIDRDDQVAMWDFLARYPMLHPVVEGSLAQIVHVPEAAADLAARYAGTNPSVVAMGVADPFRGDPAEQRRQARAGLGLAEDRFVVGVFGIVHPLKKLESCIAAAARLRAEGLDVLLLVAGPIYDADWVGRLVAVANRLGAGDHVIFTDRLAPEAFTADMLAVDVVLNLRMAVQQHMSAIIMRSIAAGKPILVSDLPEWRVFPDSFCVRIPPGDAEVPALRAALGRLARDPGGRGRMGAAAREYFERESTIAAMANRYLEIIEQTIARPSSPEPSIGEGAAPGQAGEGAAPGQAGEGAAPGQAGEGAAPGQAGEGAAPGQAGEGAAPGQAGEGAAPGQAGEGAAPGQAREGAAPGQAGEGAAPGQAGEGAAPGQAREGAAPGQAGEGAAPGQAGEGAAPGQAGEGAAPGQAGEGAAPGQAGEGAAPGQAGEGAAPGQAGEGAAPGQAGEGAAPGQG